MEGGEPVGQLVAPPGGLVPVAKKEEEVGADASALVVERRRPRAMRRRARSSGRVDHGDAEAVGVLHQPGGSGRAGAHRLDRCVCPVDHGLVGEAEERALPVVVGRVAAGPVVDGDGGAENGVGGTERPSEANGQGHVAGTGLGQDGGLDQEGADHRRHGDPGHGSRAEVEGRAGATRPDGPAAFENEAVQRPNVGELSPQ